MGSLFSKFYDRAMGPLERKTFLRIRSELLQHAQGTVLEVGSGTGVNFTLYKNVEVIAIEPDEEMRNQSLERVKAALVRVTVLEGDAQELRYEDNSFDTVVATLVLCTVPNMNKAIEEMVRVCKPNGKILLFEHVKVNNKGLQMLQNWLTPAWKILCAGCHLNRDTAEVLKKRNDVQIEIINSYFKDIFVTIEARKK